MWIVRVLLCAIALGAIAEAALIAGEASAQTEKRVALVVGNSNYQHVPSLENPANDARLIAETLQGLGFTLVGNGPQLDLDEAAFRRAVQDFGTALTGAQVALFYYAGHGVQVRGANYLVPVAANPVREADVDFQMLDTALVLRQMEGSGTSLNLVILDACRNNPFGGSGLRSADSGLAQMRAPEGTLISFATQPGNVALDGTGGNSPYTKALTDAIRKPGLDIFRTFNEVGLAVARATGGAQQPWVSLSPIKGDFYFAGLPAGGTRPSLPTPLQPQVDPAAQAWAVTQNTTSVAVLEEFIRQFGSTVYGGMARARLAELKKVAIVAPPAPPGVPPSATKPAVGVSPPSSGATPLSPERERSLKPKDAFKECDDCPEMVVVPAGSFMMGSPTSEADRFANEGPQHRVRFTRPFAVGRYSVTFDEWDACVREGGCNGYRPSDEGWGRGNRPVINIDFNDARAYVAWLSKKTGKAYRLLTEAEQEYVTRAGTTTPFWWGRSISTDQANYIGTTTYGGGKKGPFRKKTEPVDSFAPNPWGLYQVHGNVWTWTEDCWNDSYHGAPADGSAWLTGDCSKRILRGGAYNYFARILRSAFRGPVDSDKRNNHYGVRVARTLGS
jgi:formylglycine-generating enzyme required for sulfatase activity